MLFCIFSRVLLVDTSRTVILDASPSRPLFRARSAPISWASWSTLRICYAIRHRYVIKAGLAAAQSIINLKPAY